MKTLPCYPFGIVAGTLVLATLQPVSAQSRLAEAPALSAKAKFQLHFEEVGQKAGVHYVHGYRDGPASDQRFVAGGVGAADVDNDGFVDLYVVGGSLGPNRLFRNLGNGTFEDIAPQAGLDIRDALGSGPTFADFDRDGRPDLVLGCIETTSSRLFRNRGDGSFEDITHLSPGFDNSANIFSAAFGDYDLDGDADLFVSRWNPGGTTGAAHLWRNLGNGAFEAVSDAEAGLNGYEEVDFSLTPNFADIDSDGFPDLLIASDFGTSSIYRNLGDGTFENLTSPVISDENGMGAAVGDYDNDGDLDWFVSSIWDPDPAAFGWGTTGNRLYRNLGDGTFEDVTSAAGVREGFWGWGACFADFNNDGHMDLFHVNGFRPPTRDREGRGEIFLDDPSRLFMADGEGGFKESSRQLTLNDTGQGRGVVCFDYDRDGDIDIFIASNSEGSKLFQNQGGNQNGFLTVRLRGEIPGRTPLGARIYVQTAEMIQMREFSAGSNYVSQQPDEVHFGLGKAQVIDELRIVWPGGREDVFRNVAPNQILTLGFDPGPVITTGRRWTFR